MDKSKIFSVPIDIVKDFSLEEQEKRKKWMDIAESYRKVRQNKVNIDKWLENAGIDKDGRYVVILDTDYPTFEKYGTPYYYVVNVDFSLSRPDNWFCWDLLKEGRAVESTRQWQKHWQNYYKRTAHIR